MDSSARLNWIVLRLAIVVLGGTLTVSPVEPGQARGGESEMSPQAIEEALKAYTPQLMALPGVVGTALARCEGRPCIKVLVVQRSPELERDIRTILEGYPVVIEETGRVRARPEKPGGS